jgi:AAA domain
MTSLATTQRGERPAQPTSTGVSRAAGLLRRDDLLARLDRAATRKVTVISAPPGSGKTSLLRTWSDRSSKDRRVAFVSVRRDQQDAQQFWLAVLDAIRQSAGTSDSRTRTAPPAFDGDAMVDTVDSELAEQAKVVALVIDDLHELSSADALAQLEENMAAIAIELDADDLAALDRVERRGAEWSRVTRSPGHQPVARNHHHPVREAHLGRDEPASCEQRPQVPVDEGLR